MSHEGEAYEVISNSYYIHRYFILGDDLDKKSRMKSERRTDRQTETEIDRQTDRQTDRQRERDLLIVQLDCCIKNRYYFHVSSNTENSVSISRMSSYYWHIHHF